jgi:UDPglucose 6-dehydrogenase
MVPITIIGSGVIGSATGKGFSKFGHEVCFYDISNAPLSRLNGEGYVTKHNLIEAMEKSDISFVCVNTPTLSSGEQDLSQIESAVHSISDALNKIDRKQLIVFRSTMIPGTMRKTILPLLDRLCIKKRGIDYNVYYNPEFLRQEKALEDFFKPDRVVIGEDIKDSSTLLDQIYRPLSNNIIKTDLDSAEMIKYVSNCFLALKISFFNEIGLICKRANIDHTIVNHAVSLDRRIGEYGTRAGFPFGVACFPKDTKAFSTFMENLGIDNGLLKRVFEINDEIANLVVKNYLR